MKLHSILVIISLHGANSLCQGVITGKISDSAHNKITIYEPINGFCNRIIEKPGSEIRLDNNNRFKRLVNVTVPVVITISIGDLPVWLVVEPGDSLNVDINIDKFTKSSPNGGITVNGKNGKGDELFNYFNFQPGKKFADFEAMLDSLKFRTTSDLNSLDYATSKIVSSFDTLLKQGYIDKAFYQITAGDAKAALLTEICKIELHKNQPDLDNALAFLDSMYKRNPPTPEIM